MRRGPGDTVLLFNGRDGEFAARIETIRRDRRQPCASSTGPAAQTPEPDLWLAFALLKRDATDLVVQKATELGVAALLPVLTERSNTHRMNADRLTAIAIEAAEQCERLTVPDAASRRGRSRPAVATGRPAAACSPPSSAATRRRHPPPARPARTAGRSGRRLLAGGA